MTLLIFAFVVFAAVLGTLIYRKYELSRLTPAEPQPQKTGTLIVALFFASPDGAGLVREAREIDACSDPTACADAVVEELVNGPVGDMSPTLPPSTIVHAVRVEGDTATVDFGKEFADGLPAGSNAQIMAVYSVVDSLAYNFPSVKNVKFLLGGESVKTLGELDLSAPLPPDFSLEIKAKGPAAEKR
jgi:Sporulation and spore germination